MSTKKPNEVIDLGNKAVKKPEDKDYQGEELNPKISNPAKRREVEEQPVQPVKNAPKDK